MRVTPLVELYAHLQGKSPLSVPKQVEAGALTVAFAAYEKLGYVVDARLHAYAAGIEVAKKYGLGK